MPAAASLVTGAPPRRPDPVWKNAAPSAGFLESPMPHSHSLVPEEPMSQQGAKRRGRKKRIAQLPPELAQVNLDAAGIDVAAECHFVAVPPGRDPDGGDVRKFGAFTADLYALAPWVSRVNVTTVVMESN